MAISYMLAELCGNAVNPIAGIWFAVASSFFLVIGGISLIEAIMIASEGMESRQEQEQQRRRVTVLLRAPEFWDECTSADLEASEELADICFDLWVGR